MQPKKEKLTLFVYLVLRILVLLVMCLQIWHQNYENVFVCILTLVLLMVPSILEHQLKVQLPGSLEIIILVFIFSAEILGEIESFYLRFPLWDTILHVMNGFIAAGVGFSLVDILNNDDRLQFQLSPVFMALVAFSFSMTIGVLWEFFEYSADHLLHVDMQKDTVIHEVISVSLDPTQSNTPIMIDGIESVVVNGEELGLGGYLDIGLNDTMGDLFVNFIGAFVFSTLGYFYVKNRGRQPFLKAFLPYTRKNRSKEHPS